MTTTTAQWFGHPRGLSTLFFTELWERFSYYGMRALLLLYMTDVATGGLDLGTERSSAIYGLYTFGVYALALPGGWVADRILGQKKAVLWGGIIIALGHYSLAVPSLVTFFLGLFLVVVGTGLLKPNVSAVVGDLYVSDTAARRDAGFSIFYSGINIGALAGPLVCSYLGENIDWHLGFGAAGVGMTAAIVAYVRGQRHLEGAGDPRGPAADPVQLANAKRSLIAGTACIVVLTGILWWLGASGIAPITLVGFADATGLIVVVLAAVYFAYVIGFVCNDATERRRVGACAVLFVGAALFWSGFEQAGSSLNLFTRDYVNRDLWGLVEVPIGSLQSVNPFFIIVLAPVMGALWVKLGDRSPSIPVKFGLGLVLLGVGFAVLSWGASMAEAGGEQAAMAWLVVTYFFHTVGELCLSPVGLSSMTKLAPDRLVSQMMGTWFMGAALGNLIAGRVAGYIEALPPAELFRTVALIVAVAGVVFLVLFKPIRWLCAGVK